MRGDINHRLRGARGVDDTSPHLEVGVWDMRVIYKKYDLTLFNQYFADIWVACDTYAVGLSVVLEVLILILAREPVFLLTGTTANQCSPGSVTVTSPPHPHPLLRSGNHPNFLFKFLE